MAATSHVTSTVPSALRLVATNEKVTGPAGVQMLKRSGIMSSEASPATLSILDNACGGGVLMAELLQLAEQHPGQVRFERLIAADVDDSMVAYTTQRKEANAWTDVEVVKADQQRTSLPDGAFTHIFSNFGIFFAKDVPAALVETRRMLRPGGTAGFTSWKTIKWWDTLAMPALAQYLPDAPPLPHPLGALSSGWSNTSAIAEKMEQSGFVDVQISEYSFTPDVEPEEFAEACGFLVKLIAQRVWPSEVQERSLEKIEQALLMYLKENYPGGKWSDQMTAIVTLTKKP